MFVKGKTLDRQTYECLGVNTRQAKVLNRIGWAVSIATFIVGCLGAAGTLPTIYLFPSLIGLGGGKILLSLSGGNFKNRKFDLLSTSLFALAIVAMGSLGMAGFLGGQLISSAVIGIQAGAFFFSFCLVRGIVEGRERKRLVQENFTS
ncbi:MAG: hypothetical protein K940chlam9_00052 [Chlamydiae bacterium]|nr:hypothetical protein [Chlamydiota bacterium]